MSLRKRTVFIPCERHAPKFATLTRYRLAEIMVEGGPTSPCVGDTCCMRPGRDFYTAEFVANNPTYTLGADE